LRDFVFFSATCTWIRKTLFLKESVDRKKFSLHSRNSEFSYEAKVVDASSRTTDGRTSKPEWKVLRDTDGERFVLQNKVSAFSGEFVNCEKRKSTRRDKFDD
jgi:hypothetical protein